MCDYVEWHTTAGAHTAGLCKILAQSLKTYNAIIPPPILKVLTPVFKIVDNLLISIRFTYYVNQKGC